MKLASQTGHPAHTHFIGAWNAISYRYKAVAEYDQQLTASIVTHGPGAGDPNRYEQERDLFEFFSSGVSVFDAFCFGAFAIGAFASPTHFPLNTDSDERKVNWKSLLQAYNESFATDPITLVLHTVKADAALKAIRRVRDILTHRSSPARQFSLLIGSPTKSTARIHKLNLTLDQNTTSLHRKEIARLLSDGLSGMRTFVEAKII